MMNLDFYWKLNRFFQKLNNFPQKLKKIAKKLKEITQKLNSPVVFDTSTHWKTAQKSLV